LRDQQGIYGTTNVEKPAATTSPSRFLAETHVVTNVARELQDYNLYATDIALRCGSGPEKRPRTLADPRPYL